MANFTVSISGICIYIVTYGQDEWHEYIQEIEALHITMANFTVSISGICIYLVTYVQDEWHECI